MFQATAEQLAGEGRAQPRYQLEGGQFIRKRVKEACLRVPRLTPESSGDEYYYSLLLLYLPWRQEEELLEGHASAMAAFVAKEGELQVLHEQNAAFADEVRFAVDQLRVLDPQQELAIG